MKCKWSEVFSPGADNRSPPPGEAARAVFPEEAAPAHTDIWATMDTSIAAQVSVDKQCELAKVLNESKC